MNVFKKVIVSFERNNKKMQINSSGSVPGAKLEKIRSGQSYLYQANRMESEVFEITFRKKVSGSILNHALLETLLYYYCKIRYNSSASFEGILLADDLLFDDETMETNLGSYSFEEKTEPVSVPCDAYSLPENVIEHHDTYYRYDVQVPTSGFMKVCKKNHATPVILTSLLIGKGIAKVYPDFDKLIDANIAVDIREALDLLYTFKNCVRSMPLVGRKATVLNVKRERNYLRKAANASLGLFNKLDALPDYKAKQGMMGFFNGMLMNTYVIGYFGQLIVNENEKYIDRAEFYNSSAAGLGVNILFCGEKFCFNFKQIFVSDKYVKVFFAELNALGISYHASEAIPFLTPKDEIIKRTKGEIV